MFWKLSLSFHTEIEHCVNSRCQSFFFRSACSGSSMKPSNQWLVVRRRPGGAPLTASRFYVEVSFPNWSLPSVYSPDNSCSASCQSCRIYNRRILNKKYESLHYIVNYLLKLCFEIFLQNGYYIEILHIIAFWWNCLHKYSRCHMTLAYSSCLINLKNQRLVVGRRPSKLPLTASRFYIWAYFLNWWSVSICIRSNSGLVSWNDTVSFRMIEI